MHPTAAGLAVLEHARRVLFTMNQIAQEAATFGAGVTGHVRMVATASAIAELLDDIAAFMRERANRNIRVDIEERVSDDLVRHVRDGMASIGVCWDSVNLEANCGAAPIARIGWRSRCIPQHALAQAQVASLRADARGMITSACRPTPPCTGCCSAPAARLGRTVSYRVIVSNFDAAFRVVAANLAISVVPVEVGGPYASMLGIKLVPLADAWTQAQLRDLLSRLRCPVAGSAAHGRAPGAAGRSRCAIKMNALRGLALLLLFQAAGEGVTKALALPFPGPVVGLVLILVALRWRLVREPVQETAELLLAHLSLLFVPVGVGVITHLDLIAHYGLQLLVVIVASTWIGLAATALTLRRLLKPAAHPAPPEGP